jgi:hypothetical protein
VAYADTDFPLNQYAVSFGTTTTSATFTAPATPPASFPAVNDPAVGLKVGDLLLLSGVVSGSTTVAVAEVTGTSGTASPYTVSFAATDLMNLNQTGGNSGLSSLVTPSVATGVTATRILLITYSIDIPVDASSPTGFGTPRLMRQLNGREPVPISDNVSDLRFTYDIYDETRNPKTQNTLDAYLSTGASPNFIRNVNIKHLTMRSAISGTKGYQGMDIQTSISARNLGYGDRYPITP